MLGYRFWRRDLGGRPDVLGLTVTSGTRSYRVIGVLSAASDHPGIAMISSPIWVPWVVRRDQAGFIGILARVRPDRTRAMVADELRALAAAPEWTPLVSGPLDAERARVSRWMLLALGASGLLVLLGCVNAANLMLSRSVRRARELAVRASLGASTRRIAAGVVAEGLLLSLAATALALLLAAWGVDLARHTFSTLPLGISQAAGIAFNGRVMAAAIASAIVTGVLFSLVPAWQASRASIVSSLREGAPAASAGRGRWRLAFLVTEVATVTVLLVVSWLFVASLVRVVGVDLGVDRSRLIGLSPRVPYRTTADDVVARIRHVPGVADVAESTGATLTLFLGGVWLTTNVSAPDAALELPFEVFQYRVTPNFFAVAGIGFLRGTVWADGAPNPVVLDDIVARRLFGEANPLGRQVRASEPAGVHTVVGHIGLGLALGLPVAWWLSRGFGSLLFGVTPADLWVYAGVAALVCAVALVSALLPSRRAARVNPIVSLRA